MPFPRTTVPAPRRGRTAAALAALLLIAGGCAAGTGIPATARETEEVSTELLRRPLSVLAADSLEGRFVGTRGADLAAHFLARELQLSGVAPAYPAPGGGLEAYFQTVPLGRDADGGRIRLLADAAEYAALPPERRVEGVNVIGIVRGMDPTLRDEAVVVGAHYDHVGIGPAVDGDSIYNGADDDASGVVTVLEIARSLAAGPPPARTVIILLSTAEEQGLLGTLHYLRDPVVPLDRTVADLQIEMVGRPDDLVGGAGQAWLTGFERSDLGARFAEAGLPIVPDPRPTQRFFERSDNFAFACLGIPAHTLSSFGLHSDYHGPGDEIERIDFDHLAVIAEAATRAVRLLTNGEVPRWLDGGDPSRDPALCR